jgi:hypothetical protein
MYIYPEQDHQLESRMREIRTSGAEGGGALTGSPYLYRSFAGFAGFAGETPALRQRSASAPPALRQRSARASRWLSLRTALRALRIAIQ